MHVGFHRGMLSRRSHVQRSRRVAFQETSVPPIDWQSARDKLINFLHPYVLERQPSVRFLGLHPKKIHFNSTARIFVQHPYGHLTYKT